MKTYVINLKRATDRRNHMMAEMASAPFLDGEFVEGVDGYALCNTERKERFDDDTARKLYGRICNPGEVGCTLSHQSCYRKLITSGHAYALILEDDVVLRNRLALEPVIKRIESLLRPDKPEVVLLSGGFWYTRLQALSTEHSLASVFGGWYAHSYIITRTAAEALSRNRPYYLADDWQEFKRKGIKIRGVVPHLIDQKEHAFVSDISGGAPQAMNKSNLKPFRLLRVSIHGLIRKLLRIANHYENV